MLQGVALTITAKVSSNGQLYGSVTNMTVAEELAKLGKEVDRKIIVLKDIKKVGEYVAVVRFHKEVSAEIPVTVVAEAGEEPVKAAVKEAPAAEAPVEEAPVEEAPAVEDAPVDEAEAPVAE